MLDNPHLFKYYNQLFLETIDWLVDWLTDWPEDITEIAAHWHIRWRLTRVVTRTSPDQPVHQWVTKTNPTATSLITSHHLKDKTWQRMMHQLIRLIALIEWWHWCQNRNDDKAKAREYDKTVDTDYVTINSDVNDNAEIEIENGVILKKMHPKQSPHYFETREKEQRQKTRWWTSYWQTYIGSR